MEGVLQFSRDASGSWGTVCHHNTGNAEDAAKRMKSSPRSPADSWALDGGEFLGSVVGSRFKDSDILDATVGALDCTEAKPSLRECSNYDTATISCIRGASVTIRCENPFAETDCGAGSVSDIDAGESHTWEISGGNVASSTRTVWHRVILRAKSSSDQRRLQELVFWALTTRHLPRTRSH